MTDVVVTDQAFGGVAREKEAAEGQGATFAEYDVHDEAGTALATAGARVVFVNFAPITAHVLDGLAPGAVVIRYGIGFDNVDIPAATARGIRVCNVPDYGADTVADHTVALLLASLRRLAGYTAGIRRGWMTPSDVGPVRGFAETTVGLIGTGRIGRAVAQRLAPFGFEVIAFDPYVEPGELHGLGIEPVDFDQLLERSHAVSLHAPLTTDSRHILGSAQFEAMNEGVVIINTSRGPLVDEEALEAALASGRVGAAGLDVFENEPLAHESSLRSNDNVLLTPHAAFYSRTSLANLQRLAAEEAVRALRDEPLRCPINP